MYGIAFAQVGCDEFTQALNKVNADHAAPQATKTPAR